MVKIVSVKKVNISGDLFLVLVVYGKNAYNELTEERIDNAYCC